MHLHAVGKKPRHEAGRLKLDHYITHRFKGVEGGDRGRSPEGGLRGGMPLGHHLETRKTFPIGFGGVDSIFIRMKLEDLD